MKYLQDEALTEYDAEELIRNEEIHKADDLCGYQDDGIMHLETIQKLEAIAARSAADLILEEDYEESLQDPL